MNKQDLQHRQETGATPTLLNGNPLSKRETHQQRFQSDFCVAGGGVGWGGTAHPFGFSYVVPACSWKFMLQNISGEQMAVRPRPLIWDHSERLTCQLWYVVSNLAGLPKLRLQISDSVE